MKSDFSRFLHYIMSYSGLTRISRSNKVANFFHLDTPVKPECDTMGTDASLKFDNDKIVNAGRSRVEMLGVLAIIGVLSVGAIAGYSKAMNKYKINKTIESANQLLATVFTKFATDKSLLYADDGNASLTQIIVKSGWVPDGLKPYENVPHELQDSFGNGVWIFTDVYHKTIGIGWGFKKSQKELCYNFLSLAKGRNDSLTRVIIDQTRTDPAPVKEYGTFYGTSYCQPGPT